jgi:acetyltransferase-like isoleucine patch superfamily enzyme
MKLDQRVSLRLHRMVWPESAAALRVPQTADFPAPRDFARFGAGSWLVPPAKVSGAEHIDIGAGVVLMEHAELRAEPEGAPAGRPLMRIGDGTRLARFVTLWATVGIDIGEGVSSSDYVAVLDCWALPGSPTAPPAAPIVIRDGAYLGCRSIIGPGVTVGEGAFVGEGAVVLDDVPAHAVVYGNPARVTRQWTEADGWQGDMFGPPLP